MKINLSQVTRSQPSRQPLLVHSPNAAASAPASSAIRVSISPEARAAAKAEGEEDISETRPMAGLTLMQLVTKYDYENITPEQFAGLAGELFARGEISQKVAGAFVGTDLDTLEPISRQKSINMVDHMESMLIAAKAASSYATEYHTEVADTLKNIISFSKGQRINIGEYE